MSSRFATLLFASLLASTVAAAQMPPPSASEAWAQLQAGFDSSSADARIQTVTALSVIGTSGEAERMLRSAFHDKEVDVRLAAIVAAGETKDRNLIGDLRTLLDDPAPEVAFTAATTLWKAGDRSGEDVLLAVVRGERKASPGFMKSATHNANRTLHKPGELLKIGAMQATSILVPPVGMGMGAYKYLDGPSKDPRVQALDLLAKEHNELVHRGLMDATDDKDDAVRLVAAEELAKYPGAATADALGKMFGDGKTAVRLMACAAFLRVSSGGRGAAHGKRK